MGPMENVFITFFITLLLSTIFFGWVNIKTSPDTLEDTLTAFPAFVSAVLLAFLILLAIYGDFFYLKKIPAKQLTNFRIVRSIDNIIISSNELTQDFDKLSWLKANKNNVVMTVGYNFFYKNETRKYELEGNHE